jgi:hypothetical protein
VVQVCGLGLPSGMIEEAFPGIVIVSFFFRLSSLLDDIQTSDAAFTSNILCIRILKPKKSIKRSLK